MSKFLGFLLGVAVALAGPAVFGVLAAPGGIELNAKEMALAYGIGALIFWTVASYFTGAGALGAFVAFGALIYCWYWIPNRTTNFLNDVPGVTTGMIAGSKQYTLNGVVPILAVISLVYAIQLIVQSAQRRRRERAEAERLQWEQAAGQAQQEADEAAVYPVAAGTYSGQYDDTYGNRSRFDDLFDDDPEPMPPRSQADEQTAQFPTAGQEDTAQFPAADNDAEGNYPGDDTVLVPTDRDDTVQVTATPEPQQEQEPEATTQAAPTQAAAAAEQAPVDEHEQVTQAPVDDDEQVTQAPVEDGDDQITQVPMTGGPQAGPAPKSEAATPAAKGDAEATAPEGKGGEAERGGMPPVPEVREQEVAPAPGVREQMGSQYRERMEDPEDTGEFFISAFENPPVINGPGQIRAAGA